MATCMAMGQGAGTAAAFAGHSKCTMREVDITLLRQQLVRDGQYLLNEDIEEVINKALILERVNGSGEKAAHYNPFQNQS